MNEGVRLIAPNHGYAYCCPNSLNEEIASESQCTVAFYHLSVDLVIFTYHHVQFPSKWMQDRP